MEYENYDIYFNSLDGKECNLYLPNVEPNHAFFRLGKNLVILSDGHSRFEFVARGTCIDARDFYKSDYLEGITWLGPFYCEIDGRKFVSLENNNNFKEGDIVATIDKDYYFIHSSLYDEDDSDNDSDNDEQFLDNLM